ncbi:MAG TPA: EboA domain-containing protein [Cellvibrionaceae bacterium]
MTPLPQTPLDQLIHTELSADALHYWTDTSAEIRTGASPERFAALFAKASRYAKRQPLSQQTEIDGLNTRDWSQLELLRIGLLLARNDLASADFAQQFERLFRFADEGETCALYRALPLLPDGQRFVWRAAEGCRTNMQSVFNAVALDSPYAVRYFDETAWQQLVMKALFTEADIHRIVGLDGRLSAELTRMALDFAAERNSAGRGLIPGFWLILGAHHTAAVGQLAAQCWPDANTHERMAIAFALGRAEQTQRLHQLAQTTTDPLILNGINSALAGEHSQQQFALLNPTP